MESVWYFNFHVNSGSAADNISSEISCVIKKFALLKLFFKISWESHKPCGNFFKCLSFVIVNTENWTYKCIM